MKKFFLLFYIFLILSCTERKNNDTIKFGISVDISSLNPLFAFTEVESNLGELLFLSLVYHKWDQKNGEMLSEKILAKEIIWNKDSSEVEITIRDDCYWTDGEKITVDDIIYTYEISSDPEIESSLLGYYSNFITLESGKIDVSKTFKVLSDKKMIVKFKEGSHPSEIDLDILILPKHVLSKIPKDKLSSASFNHSPVTSGAYKIKEWKRNHYILLEKNDKSFLVNSNTIPYVEFKIIPDYNNRISQLKNGEIDYLDYIESENIDEIRNTNNFNIEFLKGRFYDYLGFINNRDGKPHYLFGDAKVRRAIAYALDRETVINKFLFSTGDLASGPVSDIFKSILQKELKAILYNPDSAKILLKEAGFVDLNKDGVLEKNNRDFTFTLYLSSGNPKRIYASEIFKENLAAVGIKMNVTILDINDFMEKLFAKKLDAWMIGFGNSIPINLKPVWYSDTKQAQMNFFNYKNSQVDSLLDAFERVSSKKKKNQILNRVNKLIYKDQPCVFLYYLDNVVAINKRIKNYTVNSLYPFARIWDWKIEE